jgi:hypothetical protein
MLMLLLIIFLLAYLAGQASLEFGWKEGAAFRMTGSPIPVAISTPIISSYEKVKKAVMPSKKLQI